MAPLQALLLVALVTSWSVSSGRSLGEPDPDSMREPDPDFMRGMYEQWIATYKRSYKDNAEKEERFLIFKKNVEYIEEFNRANNHSYELGINQFADLTKEEFLATYTGYKGLSSLETTEYGPFRYENVTEIPAEIDWRAKGVVTPVKNQGACGSCWAFSAVAAVESLNRLQAHPLLALSEQELVDCDKKGEDEGCSGGLIDSAFKYILSKGGLVSESKYPYKAKDEHCNTTTLSRNPLVKIGGYEHVPPKNETALQKAVAHQPVSVAVEVNGDFQFYKKGVFDGGCGDTLNHAVVVVGYGISSKGGEEEKKKGVEYWLVRNSWGVTWGEKGYIRMKKDVGEKKGLCGIASMPSYPIPHMKN